MPCVNPSLGMLLTGTGAFNYGAQQACGLNREEAMWHLHQAMTLNPELNAANVRTYLLIHLLLGPPLLEGPSSCMAVLLVGLH